MGSSLETKIVKIIVLIKFFTVSEKKSLEELKLGFRIVYP